MKRELTEGLVLERKSCPLGVLCIIFEARPEAVIQISSLAIKSGNAVILKGGKEAAHSNAALAGLVRQALLTVAQSIYRPSPAPAATTSSSGGAAGAAHATHRGEGETGSAVGAAVSSPAAGSGPSPASLLRKHSLLQDAVQLVASREAIAELLKQDENIDLVIPRGSAALVKSIQASTRIPVMGHADGLCSIYLDKAAVTTLPATAATTDAAAAAAAASPASAAAAATVAALQAVQIAEAVRLIVDSKCNYPAACNAAETLLVHRDLLQHPIFPAIVQALLAAGVTLHCDSTTLPLAQAAEAALPSPVEVGEAAAVAACVTPPQGIVVPATAEEAESGVEWLSLDITVKAVDSLSDAVQWINSNGSGHTDCIITHSGSSARTFQASVDSAGVYWNASTRFADGYRYGFGAEVGISTHRLHARGPVGLEGLLTYKYCLQGQGHTVGQMAAPGAVQEKKAAGGGAAGGGAGEEEEEGGKAAGLQLAGQRLPQLFYTHKDLPLQSHTHTSPHGHSHTHGHTHAEDGAAAPGHGHHAAAGQGQSGAAAGK